jgi:hypothetical protein
MNHKIQGDVMHIPSKESSNKFLIVGLHYADGVRLPGQDVDPFRLVDESRVGWLVATLPRVMDATAEWKNQETTGVLHLVLQPPTTAAQAQADAQAGGQERSLHFKDLERDISKDQDIGQSRTRTKSNDPKRGEPAADIEPPPPPPPARGLDRF